MKHAAGWKTVLHADRQAVEQAKRHYLPWVRAALRDTMGLTLSRGGGADGIRRPEHEVRIEVEDGTATHWARRLWESLPIEGRAALGAGEALRRTRAAVKAVERETLDSEHRRKWASASNQLERLEHEGEAALKALRKAVQELARGEGADQVVDPFGTYTRARGATGHGQAKGAPGHIKLWWFPIAIMARTTGTSVPHFTLSTLAHEMAHAYSDAGVDGDPIRGTEAGRSRGHRRGMDRHLNAATGANGARDMESARGVKPSLAVGSVRTPPRQRLAGAG